MFMFAVIGHGLRAGFGLEVIGNRVREDIGGTGDTGDNTDPKTMKSHH